MGLIPYNTKYAPPAARATCGTGAFEIERHRQKVVYLYSSEDDDHFEEGELVNAALCYAGMAIRPADNDYHTNVSDEKPRAFPWSQHHWRPSPDPQRNLEKAGALLAAEWDRLERLKGGAQL